MINSFAFALDSFIYTVLNKIVIDININFQAQSKDILLFRYENPNKIFRNNIVALMIFPCYAWLSYFTYELRAELLPYKDSEVLDRKGSGWVYQATLFNATRWLGVVVFIFGKLLDLTSILLYIRV